MSQLKEKCTHLLVAYFVTVEILLFRILFLVALVFTFFLTYKPSYFPINLLKPTGHVMHQQFNIQQLYVLPTLYLCVLYLSENKQRLVPLTA